MPRRKISEQVGEEPVDVLARRPSKAERNRSWERDQAKEVGIATYRGIPRKLNARLVAVARELGVPVGQVARLFLEFGLEAYERGDLVPAPVLVAGKYGLFPPGK